VCIVKKIKASGGGFIDLGKTTYNFLVFANVLGGRVAHYPALGFLLFLGNLIFNQKIIQGIN